MSLVDALKSATRIEIEAPPQPGDSQSPVKRVVIDSAPTIRRILSTLQLKTSGKEAVLGCKVPPGFIVRFVTNERTYDADVTVSGHKHLVVREGSDGKAVHYELPTGFEKTMQPYLRAVLGLNEWPQSSG
jgi:hypothetical protein